MDISGSILHNAKCVFPEPWSNLFSFMKFGRMSDFHNIGESLHSEAFSWLQPPFKKKITIPSAFPCLPWLRTLLVLYRCENFLHLILKLFWNDLATLFRFSHFRNIWTDHNPSKSWYFPTSFDPATKNVLWIIVINLFPKLPLHKVCGKHISVIPNKRLAAMK